MFVANRQLKKCQKNLKRLKSLVATLEHGFSEIERVEKALKNITEDRDNRLEMLVKQSTLIENQSVRIKELKENLTRSEEKLEMAEETKSLMEDLNEAPPMLRPVEVVALPCPACERLAKVVWKRTLVMDILDGKCDYCGYHMNAIRGHGNKS